MKSTGTFYGLVGVAARTGGLFAALAVVVAGSFRGVEGWALFFRTATVFLVVTIALNVLGFVAVRSLLSAVVAGREERKEPAGVKRTR